MKDSSSESTGHGLWGQAARASATVRLLINCLILSWLLSLSELQENEGNSDHLTRCREGRPSEKTRTKLGTMPGAW